jgi:DNA-directed RNA polymerase subunit RPC12/RpoP
MEVCMAYKCKNCGGDVSYNVKLGKLVCAYCGSQFDLSEYEDIRVEKEEKDAWDLPVYLCQSCGAALVAGEHAIVTYCQYCGSESLIKSDKSVRDFPKTMIPFKLSKEDCKSQYQRRAARIPFLPEELKDPKYLERFNGFYIPYWDYRIHMTKNPAVTIHFERNLSPSLYETSVAEANIEVSGASSAIVYDASSSFDDAIDAKISDFNLKDLTAYDPKYMAGFYADTADVDKSTYQQQAIEAVSENVMQDARQQLLSGQSQSYGSVTSFSLKANAGSAAEAFGTETRAVEQMLLPVWFLTWKKGDRLAYAVMNGQTGTMAAEFPIDSGKFRRALLITAVVMFLILIGVTSFVSIMPSTMLILVALGLMILLKTVENEALELAIRENHVNDLGFKSSRKAAARDTSTASKTLPGLGAGRFNSSTVVVIIICVALALSFLGFSISGPVLMLLTAVFGLDAVVKTLKAASFVKEKGIGRDASVLYALILLALLVILLDVHFDYVYYTLALLSLLAAFGVSRGMIRRVNLLATRPMPDFHERKGGNNDVKD